MPEFEPDRVRIPASSQGPWAKNSKYEYCYQFSNIDFMPSEGNLDARHPTAEELQAFISYVLGHMLRNAAYFAKNNVTGLVTVLIFDVFCPRPLIAWANQLQNGLRNVLRKQKAGARAMRTPAQYRDDMSVTFYT